MSIVEKETKIASNLLSGFSKILIQYIFDWSKFNLKTIFWWYFV